MSLPEDILALKDAAIAAMAAGDWATASAELNRLQATLGVTPDIEREGFSSKYEREWCDKQIARIDRKVGAAVGIQTTKFRYAAPTDG